MPKLGPPAIILAIAVAGCATSADKRSEPVSASSGEAHVQEQQHQHRNSHGHQRSEADLAEYIARLESPDRQHWQMPGELIEALNLQIGETVADVGCGPCYLTLPIAREVGAGGCVWAVDIEPKMLERCMELAEKAGIDNLQILRCGEDDPRLPKAGIDTVLIVNTYHHFSNRVAYNGKLKSALAPGGRVAIIDFIPKSKEERGFGPALEAQIPREEVDEEFRRAGFVVSKVHTFLPEQYFVEYKVGS